MIKQVQRNGLLNDFMLGEEMVFISIWMILGCASENIEVENNYDSEVHDNWLAEEADNRELIALSPNSKISGGVNFDCALEGNGSILCWGKNDYGQVSQAPDHSIIGFQEIDVGDDHACAIRADNSIECWGRDDHGQATEPTGTFVKISAGGDTSCAIDTNGGIHCWGDDTYKEVSDVPAGLFLDLSVGGDHVCAVNTSTTINCWGRDNYGQAPFNNADFSYVQVSAGYQHTCALTDYGSYGSVVCWGRDNFGQLDSPTSNNFETLSSGGNHSCALDYDQNITCWGRNSNNQVGDHPREHPFAFISSGYNHSCGIDYSGGLYCWGIISYSPGNTRNTTNLNSNGETLCLLDVDGYIDCYGHNEHSLVTAAPEDPIFTKVAGSSQHMCSLDYKGYVTCWGSSSVLSDISNIYFPNSDIADPDHHDISVYHDPGSNIEQTCVVNPYGLVNCVGYVHTGSVPIAFDPPPQIGPTGEPFTKVSTGELHNCVLDNDGYVTCWGANSPTPPPSLYQITEIYSGQPNSLPDILDIFTDITTGYDFSCGLMDDLTIKCWGDIAPPYATYSIPNIIVSTSQSERFDRLAAGREHLCALSTDGSTYGTIECWGDNTYGQTNFPTSSVYLEISSGPYHSCALDINDEVECWGDYSIDLDLLLTFRP